MPKDVTHLDGSALDLTGRGYCGRRTDPEHTVQHRSFATCLDCQAAWNADNNTRKSYA